MSEPTTEITIICPRCEKEIDTLPIEPEGGLWTCKDCSIAFTKTGDIVGVGDDITEDGFINPEKSTNVVIGNKGSIDAQIERFVSYTGVLNNEQIEEYHQQLQPEPESNG